MTWSTVTSAAESWSDGGGGATTTWTAEGSDTTTRNTSRFVLLHKSENSTYGGIDFDPHFRETAEGGRGISYYFTEDDPVVFWDTGDRSI